VGASWERGVACQGFQKRKACMDWQIVVFVLQIMLLAVGYFLFQQARAELSARAAEAPVLSEVKALQRSIKQLLKELEETADQTSARLESRCLEAKELLASLDRRLAAWEEGERQAAPSRVVPSPDRQRPEMDPAITRGLAAVAPNTTDEKSPASAPARPDSRRQTVYALADAGEAPAAIARATGLSEGEVETLLGLRLQRR